MVGVVGQTSTAQGAQQWEVYGAGKWGMVAQGPDLCTGYKWVGGSTKCGQILDLTCATTDTHTQQPQWRWNQPTVCCIQLKS